MPHGFGWPNVPCTGGTADFLLTQVVQNALADPGISTNDKWTVIFLAGRCGRDHNTVVTDVPPVRPTGCDYVQAARTASAVNNWAQVRKELNHGGGAPPGAKKPKRKRPRPKKKKKIPPWQRKKKKLPPKKKKPRPKPRNKKAAKKK